MYRYSFVACRCLRVLEGENTPSPHSLSIDDDLSILVALLEFLLLRSRQLLQFSAVVQGFFAGLFSVLWCAASFHPASLQGQEAAESLYVREVCSHHPSHRLWAAFFG